MKPLPDIASDREEAAGLFGCDHALRIISAATVLSSQGSRLSIFDLGQLIVSDQ
jgi:hypothetical protein